jgi:hypothetical protein
VSPIDFVERARRAGGRTDHLVGLIDAVRRQDERVLDAARRFESARAAIYEARELQGAEFDPDPHLGAIDTALGDFCRAFREAGRAEWFDEIDVAAAADEWTVGLNSDEAAVAWESAAQILCMGLNEHPVTHLLATGWRGPDAAGRAGGVLRSGIQCLAMLLNMLARSLRFKRRPLDAAGALRLAREIRERYGQMGTWTPADLSRTGFDLDTLDAVLGTLHVELPRPVRWQDTPAQAQGKLDRITRALVELTQSAGPTPTARPEHPDRQAEGSGAGARGPSPEGGRPGGPPPGAGTVGAGAAASPARPSSSPVTPADFAAVADALRDLHSSLHPLPADGVRVSTAWDAVLRHLGATDSAAAAQTVAGLVGIPEGLRVGLIDFLTHYPDIYHHRRAGRLPEDIATVSRFRAHLAQLIDDSALLAGERPGAGTSPDRATSPQRPVQPTAGATTPAATASGKAEESGTPKPKRSTARGEGRAKLVSALTAHHQYANNGCLNLEPVGNNELARQADVSPSTAKAFFDDGFKGHKKYKVLCRDARGLVLALKMLNDELSPYHLLGESDGDVPALPPADDE